MGFYLAFKELWRNRGRFLLFSLVIALITTLVLFVAALGEGLGAGNRQYIEKLDADLLVYQADTDLLIAGSRIPQSEINDIRRVSGVAAAGPVGVASAAIEYAGGNEPLRVALLGVEPGLPGEPAVVTGRNLGGRNANEAVLDRTVALRTGLQAGDSFTLVATQGSVEERFELRVAGVSDGQQYAIQPSVIVPFRTWDRIRPQATVTNGSAELVANVVAVRLENPAASASVVQNLESRLEVEAVDLVTAYQNTPGYSAQQSTLDTQRYFALLIGVLVIGGFFQILTLQKVPQIGVLKAIGAGNMAVGTAAVVQILAVTVLGVAIGSAFTLALSLTFPPTIPIVFSAAAVAAAVASLLLIGPIGGLVSVGYSLRVEPLTALGLSN